MSNIFGSGKYRQVGGEAQFRPYKKWDAGDQLSGKITEIRKDKFGKPAYIIQVEEVNFKKKNEEPKVGDLVTLNSAGGLQYKIEQAGGVVIGDVIGVEYNGTFVQDKGQWKGSVTHDIDFFIAESTPKREAAPKATQQENFDL